MSSSVHSPGTALRRACRFPGYSLEKEKNFFTLYYATLEKNYSLEKKLFTTLEKNYSLEKK